LLETHILGGNAMVFDIRRNVLVVGKSRGQKRIIRMRPAIIPIKFFVAVINGIAIIFDSPIIKIYCFKNTKHHLFVKIKYLFLRFSQIL